MAGLLQAQPVRIDFSMTEGGKTKRAKSAGENIITD